MLRLRIACRTSEDASRSITPPSRGFRFGFVKIGATDERAPSQQLNTEHVMMLPQLILEKQF